MNPSVARWVKARSARIRTTIADSGVRVIGDLADLEPVELKVGDEADLEDVAGQVRDRGRRALYESGMDDAGPYQSPMEDAEVHFHEWLHARLDR